LLGKNIPEDKLIKRMKNSMDKLCEVCVEKNIPIRIHDESGFNHE